MNRLISIVGVCAGLTGAAAGDVASQSGSYDFHRLLDTGTVWIVSSFNSEGGQRVLDKVELSLVATMGADVMAENYSELPAPDFGVTLFATANARCGPLDLWINPAASAFAPAGPHDGVDQSGPDFVNFGLVVGTAEGLIEQTTGLDAFTDRGDLSISVWTDGIFFLAGDGLVYFSDYQVSKGVVVLTYTWHDVPAPGGAALACAGVASLGSRRRRPG